MKDFAFKIASIAMALLLLASTTSWKVEKHFCMGHLVDMAFFSEAKDCGMAMDGLHEDNFAGQQESSCCSEEIIFIDGQEDLNTVNVDLGVDQQFFLIAFSYSFTDLFSGLEQRIVAEEYYPPPILVRDVQILDQVFLI